MYRFSKCLKQLQWKVVLAFLCFKVSSASGAIDIESLAKIVATQQAEIQELKAGIVPIGTIVGWHESITAKNLPGVWVRCSGGTVTDKSSPLFGASIPNLNGERRFLRGGTSSGAIEEDDLKKHTHEVSGGKHPITDNGGHALRRVQMFSQNEQPIDTWRASFDGGPHGFIDEVWGAAHSHVVSETGGAEVRPKNMSIVWIMRIK